MTVLAIDDTGHRAELDGRCARRRPSSHPQSKHASARRARCRAPRRDDTVVVPQVTSGGSSFAAKSAVGYESCNDPLNKTDPMGLRPGPANDGDFNPQLISYHEQQPLTCGSGMTPNGDNTKCDYTTDEFVTLDANDPLVKLGAAFGVDVIDKFGVYVARRSCPANTVDFSGPWGANVNVDILCHIYIGRKATRALNDVLANNSSEMMDQLCGDKPASYNGLPFTLPQELIAKKITDSFSQLPQVAKDKYLAGGCRGFLGRANYDLRTTLNTAISNNACLAFTYKAFVYTDWWGQENADDVLVGEKGPIHKYLHLETSWNYTEGNAHCYD